jgi:chromosome segregation ATPase
MALDEALSTLSATLPGLPQQVQSLLTHLSGAVGDGDALMESAEDKRNKAVELLDQVEEVLQGVVEQGDDHRQKLETAAETLTTSFNELSAVESAQGELTSALDAAGEAMHALQGQLTSVVSAVEAAEQDAATQLGEIAERARSGREEVASALAHASSEAEALRQAAEGGRARIEAELSGLKDLMSSLLEQARSAVDETTGALRQQLSAHEGALSEATDQIGQGTGDLVQELEQAIATEMQEQITAAAEQVASALEELGGQAVEAVSISSGLREAAQALLSAADENVDPLAKAIESVKQAAGTAGIGW